MSYQNVSFSSFSFVYAGCEYVSNMYATIENIYGDITVMTDDEDNVYDSELTSQELAEIFGE